jgi:hypothetical protein
MKPINKIIVLLLGIFIMLGSCKKDPLKTEDKVSSHDILSDKKYGKVVVSVVYEKGYALDPQTIKNLQGFLSARLNKPDGIFFNTREIPVQGKSFLSVTDLQNMEKQYRTGFSKGNTIEIFVFVTSADFAENSGNAKVLGVAYGNTSIALFGKTINSYSGGLTQPPRSILESTVAEHEFGHLMGLVDNGTNMVEYHRDVNNGRHCDKKNCLMYYAAETSDIVSNLLGGEIPKLENYCIRDLQFNGGK